MICLPPPANDNELPPIGPAHPTDVLLFWLFVGLGNALWLAALLGLLRALGD